MWQIQANLQTVCEHDRRAKSEKPIIIHQGHVYASSHVTFQPYNIVPSLHSLQALAQWEQTEIKGGIKQINKKKKNCFVQSYK